MADFALLWAARRTILDSCKLIVRDAEGNRDTECKAVTDIQKNFRGLLSRTKYKTKRSGAIMVQRSFRGFLGRVRVLTKIEAKQSNERVAFFHYHATALQKFFRGYFSRKYLHDFFARKAYIESVVEKSNTLRQQLAAQRELSKREEQERKLREAQEDFKRATQSLHHLVSTKNCRGIYKSPFSEELEPTAFGVPIEEHLRRNTKEILRTTGLRTERKHKGRIKLSIQAQSPYDAVLEQQRAESRYSKMKRMSRRTFIAGSRASSIESKFASISIGTEYVEPWKAMRNSHAGTHTKNKKPFYNAVNTPALFDEVADRMYDQQQVR